MQRKMTEQSRHGASETASLFYRRRDAREEDIIKAVRLIKPLKAVLGISGNDAEELISFAADNAAELIMGYCRLNKLPERLYGTAVELAADIYRVKGFGSSAFPESVRSLSEGERSITYADKPSEADILAAYRERLKPYINRKGRVPSEI